MAKIELEIHANYQDAIKGTQELTKSTEKLDKETKDYNKTVQTSMKNAANATEKQSKTITRQKGLIEDLDDTIKDWENRLRKATNTKDIEKYNRKIAEGRKHLEEYKKKGLPAMQAVNKQATSGIAVFNRLATAMAAAFSVGLITRFLRQSLRAYDLQAKAERKLLVALKGRQGIQKQLLRQATELQQKTLFGDEQTIEAQAQLAKLLGANFNTISKLTPLVQDLATIYGMDLATAADLVGKSVGSSTNALSRYGITIEGAVGSAERLDTAVSELNRVVGGQAEEAAKVGIASIQQLGNAWGDVTEKIGKWATERLLPIVAVLKDLVNVQTVSTKEIQKDIENYNALYEETNKLLQEAATNAEDRWTKETGAQQTIESLRKIIDLNQKAGRPVVELEKDIENIDFLFKEVIKYQNKIKELGGTIAGETSDKVEDLTKKTNLELKRLGEEGNEIAKQILKERFKIWEDYQAKIMLEMETEGLESQWLNDLLSAEPSEEIDPFSTEFFLNEEEAIKDGTDLLTDAWLKEQEKLQQFIEENPLLAKLGFTSEEEVQAAKEGAQVIHEAITSIADSWVENTTRVVDALDTRVAETQRALDTELKLNEQGFASNVKAKQKELAQLKKERERALREQAKAVKTQQTLDTVSQTISLVTSAANIIKVFSGMGPWGIALAAVAIAGMFAAFAFAKSEAAAATKFEKGGLLDGPSHARGGIKVGNVELEGQEFVINKESTKKYLPLIEAINEDNVNLNRELIGDLNIKHSNVSIKETPEIIEIRDMMKKIMNKPSTEYYDGKKIVTFGNVRRSIG